MMGIKSYEITDFKLCFMEKVKLVEVLLTTKLPYFEFFLNFPKGVTYPIACVSTKLTCFLIVDNNAKIVKKMQKFI